MRLWVKWDKHEELWSSTTRVCGPALGKPNKMPPRAVVLSLSTEPTKGCVNATALDGVQ
jgi:hypothetical protein